jgi:hypothetical protein
MKTTIHVIIGVLLVAMSNTVLSAEEFSMNTFADSDSIGCEANPTGNPIGGGENYDDVFASGDFTVTSLDELTAALRQAQSGQVIFIPDGVEIALTDQSTLSIPGGVTLAGSRGRNGSPGARIFSTSSNFTMFSTGGDFVRVTGLRFEGQYGGTERLPYNGRFLRINYYNTRVDNCEIYNFSGHDAIGIGTGAINTYVHHNYLHHIQRSGLGYPVRVDGSSVYVIANRFDYARHHIASGGAPGASYEAAWNLIMENAIGTHFDMHGGRDRGDNTDIAGDWMHVHHNTFLSPIAHVGIRGTPSQGADIHNNWFARSVADSVRSTANTRVFNNIYGADKTPQPHAICFVGGKQVECTVEKCDFCSWTAD